MGIAILGFQKYGVAWIVGAVSKKVLALENDGIKFNEPIKTISQDNDGKIKEQMLILQHQLIEQTKSFEDFKKIFNKFSAREIAPRREPLTTNSGSD